MTDFYWHEIIEEAAQTGKTDKIVQMLRTECQALDDPRALLDLADLLAERNLKRKPRRQKKTDWANFKDHKKRKLVVEAIKALRAQTPKPRLAKCYDTVRKQLGVTEAFVINTWTEKSRRK